MPPKKSSGRIVYICYWVMCVLVYSFFTAVLTTNLTTSTLRPMSTLKEALDSGYRITVVKGTIQHHAILESGKEDGEFKRILEMIKTNPNLVVPSFRHGIESTLDKKTLFFADSTVLAFEVLNNCSFSPLPQNFLHGYGHLAFSKGFKFKEPLNQRITKILTSGIVDKLEKKWLTRGSNCSPFTEPKISLGLTKTLFAFALVVLGVFLSLAVLLTEIVVAKTYKNTKKNIRQNDAESKKIYQD